MTDLSTVLLSNTADPSYGTIRWMSPELLDPIRFGSDGLPSRQSNCFALGMLIYEVNRFPLFWSLSLTHLQVLSGLPPFDHLRPLATMRAILRGERPDKPLNASDLGFTDTLWELLQSCWSQPASARPTARRVYDCLRSESDDWTAPLAAPPATGGGVVDAGALSLGLSVISSVAPPGPACLVQ
jgi:serine/threonine protein kinase